MKTLGEVTAPPCSYCLSMQIICMLSCIEQSIYACADMSMYVYMHGYIFVRKEELAFLLTSLTNTLSVIVLGCHFCSENVGLLGLTRVGSRRVVQISTAFMIFFSIFGWLTWPLNILFLSGILIGWDKTAERNGSEEK